MTKTTGNHPPWRTIFLTLISSLTPFSLSDVSQSLRIHDLTIEDVLSQSFIFTLYQDKTGFIWIGAKESDLNRINKENKSFIRFPLTQHFGTLTVSRKASKTIHAGRLSSQPKCVF
ncbi:hypothetical protein [Caldithrix abyssi]|uniref:hypothetical protein n=1 Tax=Caldithrix abyssi TaxID=187145 RepID=UPI00123722C3|nr:hypothetical protein [Caldithrix abyssi]